MNREGAWFHPPRIHMRLKDPRRMSLLLLLQVVLVIPAIMVCVLQLTDQHPIESDLLPSVKCKPLQDLPSRKHFLPLKKPPISKRTTLPHLLLLLLLLLLIQLPRKEPNNVPWKNPRPREITMPCYSPMSSACRPNNVETASFRIFAMFPLPLPPWSRTM
jgi:hypothetical protein